MTRERLPIPRPHRGAFEGIDMSSEAVSTASPKPSGRALGYLLGALGASLFATKGIVIKLALAEGVDAVTTLTWRMIIAVPIFALVGWLGYRDRRRRDPQFRPKAVTILKTCGVGMMGYYVASYLDFVGLEYISAQFDRLILLTSPFFVMLIGAVWFGRRITPVMVGAALVSYLGLILIFARDLSLEGQDVVTGTLLVLGAALAYAFYQSLAKPLIDEIGSRLFTSIAMSAAGFAVVVHFLVTHQGFDTLIVSPNAMWLMFAIGTVSTVLPAYMIAASIGRVGAAPAAVMGNVSPLVTIALAVTVLGETFSVWHALGAALVLGGVIWFARSEQRAKAAG
ncbi:MAG: DMT family transporter [Novosphingobium sp.]